MRRVTGSGNAPVLGGQPVLRTCEGYNLTDRTIELHSNAYIRNSFYMVSATFGQYVDQIDNVTPRRQAYSCAEADAVSQLVRLGVPAADILLTIATDNTGYELVTPCRNCMGWLEEVRGWGPRREYRIQRNRLPASKSGSSSSDREALKDMGSWPTPAAASSSSSGAKAIK